MKAREFRHLRTITGSVLIILVGIVWEFSAEIQTFIRQITGQKLQEWLAAYISHIGPFVLIAGGIFWIAFLHGWPALHRWFRPTPLALIYNSQTHTSVRRRNIRDYHIELRNCTKDRTISDIVVTWDETPFTRFIDEKLCRDWLLPPTSIAPSSSASLLLFSLEDDLQIVENRNEVLGLPSTFTVRVSGKGIDDVTARFKYEPDKSPKLRRLWR
jgi:hypothetical protein